MLGSMHAKLEVCNFSHLELLAFNAQKFTGSRDHGHAHISETFVKSHVRTIHWNTRAKFEVRVFSLFGTIDNQGALGVGARGQDRLTESSGSLNDV